MSSSGRDGSDRHPGRRGLNVRVPAAFPEQLRTGRDRTGQDARTDIRGLRVHRVAGLRAGA